MDDVDPILDGMASDVSKLARGSFDDLMGLVAGETSVAFDDVFELQKGFNSDFVGAMASSMSEVTGEAVSRSAVADMFIGQLKLSNRLYSNAGETARHVVALVNEHAKGVHQARVLALRLYDGYAPKDGVVRPLEGVARAELPKALRSLTAFPFDRKSLQSVYDEGVAYSKGLKTAALRASYLQSFEAWKDGKGEQILRKSLDIAYREKSRFMANRIAQTELARAHQDRQARALMADDSISVVQVLVSPGHVKLDICDLHARANLFKLGAGCYPKALAPKPVFHPFCRCKLRSRPDLDAGLAVAVPGGDAAFLSGLSVSEASAVMGSRDRLQRMLNGEALDDVVNAGKDKVYWLQRVGDLSKKPDFNDFFHGRSDITEYPIAKLSLQDMSLFSSKTETVWLSRESLDEHKLSHPEMKAEDYLKMQGLVNFGEVYRQKTNRFILLNLDGVLYRAALKVVNDGSKVYMLSIFKTTEALANIQVRNKFELARHALKG